jgi:hypothetical protein
MRRSRLSRLLVSERRSRSELVNMSSASPPVPELNAKASLREPREPVSSILGWPRIPIGVAPRPEWTLDVFSGRCA